MGCRAHSRDAGVQHHEQQHGSVSGRLHGHQFTQVLGATGGDRIGEVAHARLLPLVEQGDGFHLDVTTWPVIILQQQVDAAVLLPVFHLGAQPGITRQRRQRPLLDQLPGDLVGPRRVDADEVTRRALGYLPAVGQLALGVVRGGVPDPGARIGTTRHGAGIGAVDGDGLTIGQLHIGEEALVAGDEQTGLQRGIEGHGVSSSLLVALARARRGQQASGS
ncbi:hypothetical protein D3C80_1177640 [compost metagenome]